MASCIESPLGVSGGSGKELMSEETLFLNWKATEGGKGRRKEERGGREIGDERD